VNLLESVETNDLIEDAPIETSDAVLIFRAKAGETGAFAELCKRHSGKIWHAAFRITRNRQDAEDAVQDSLLKAFTHLNNFQEKASFSTWLTRIAINSALMILRKKRGWSEISLDDTGPASEEFEGWEVKSVIEDPEAGCVRRERAELLGNAILRLSPLVRETIKLRSDEDYSTREIAKALDISVPAVKSRLSRAKSALREVLLPTISQAASGSQIQTGTD
jgi:RNA polymerase sigma-70 factor, ECF subfamily